MNAIHYQNGQLYVEDVAIFDIADNIPPPFYVYSQQGIVELFRAFDGAAKKNLKK